MKSPRSCSGPTGATWGTTSSKLRGICQAVTIPRVRAALTGQRDGQPIKGKYRDGLGIAEGFDENAVFLRLDYLDPELVELGRQFSAIVPMLWMTAGSVGVWEEWDGVTSWLLPEGSTYAVLFDEEHIAGFAKAVKTHPSVTHVWLVTNSHEAFAEMRQELPGESCRGPAVVPGLSAQLHCERPGGPPSMKLDLKDFQEAAVEDLAAKIRQAAQIAGPVLTTGGRSVGAAGTGKTVIATRLIERILEGDDQAGPDPDAVFLWITDLPELNRQTYNKMLDTSDILSPMAMHIIDSSFNQVALTPGRIYFLNTQKLGKDKLLTTLGDGRQYTIWQTIDNTIEDMGARFVVIIDEAHRGMRTPRDEKAAVTIIQRFLRGYDMMREAPRVLGISATPQRFNDLVAGKRTMHPVLVDAADVRASGLLKDRIILHHSEDDQQIDVTLLRQATLRWSEYTQRWASYCAEQKIETVAPLLVVQVENAPRGKSGTRTDLALVITAINDELPTPLPANAFTHAFDESTAPGRRWARRSVSRSISHRRR